MPSRFITMLVAVAACTGVCLAQEASSRLTGCLVTEDGAPVKNGDLTFIYADDGQRQPPSLRAVTGAHGRFETAFTESGTVKVVVTIPQPVDLPGMRYETRQRCFVQGKESFDLTTGKDLDIQLSVVSPEIAILGGKVTDENGVPIAATVRYINREEAEYPAFGLFLIPYLLHPEQVIEVSAPHYQSRILIPERDYRVNDTALEIRLKKGPIPVGTSVWEAVTGLPATTDSFLLVPQLEKVRSRESWYFINALPPPFDMLSAGYIRMIGLRSPRIRVVDETGAAVDRVSFHQPWLSNPSDPFPQALDFLKRPLVITEDGVCALPQNSPCFVSAPGHGFVSVNRWDAIKSELLEVVLRPTVTLEIVVTRPDGSPACGAPIRSAYEAWAPTMSLDGTKEPKTDEEGRARFEGVTPGVYALAIGTFRQDLQLHFVRLGREKQQTLKVTLFDHNESRNPQVLLQRWRDAGRMR
ncbi:MAG: hypothetical protein WC655_19655, partial [Candidatus Hydrogenedentales bacterium]